MDIATGLGLLAGATVVVTLMLMGGGLGMFVSDHAIIIIFGGSFAATLIRFPLSSIFHGLPLGMKFVFSMRRISQRELVDEIAGLAEIARKQGPIGLEKVEVEDPYLAKGIRFVADGYDAEFIRDNLERDRDNFLSHLDEGQKIYRAVGDCAPAFGMIGTLIGMVQMFANMTESVETRSVHGDGAVGDALRRGGGEYPVLADRRQAASQTRRRRDQPHADHRRRVDDQGIEEPDLGARNADRLSAGEAPRRSRA
jgi:biopolymer transport protein ExbB/TolQ